MQLLLASLCVLLLLGPPAAHAGDLKLTAHIDGWKLRAALQAFEPRYAPAVSAHHLGAAPSWRVLHARAQAIDARTFVADGVHYRVHGAQALPPGSAEEAAARAALQSVLDSGVALWTHGIEPSGIRLVTLARRG